MLKKVDMTNKTNKTIEKENHILDCLELCIQENIYSHISFDDVATKAEMSKGGLRHYFPTKESLFEALIKRFVKTISKNHDILLNDLDSGNQDIALVSTLFDFENFFMNEYNLKIFLNIILYAFENRKMMDILQSFINNNFETYYKLAKNKENASEQKAAVTARIIQIVLLAGGLVQVIDPKVIEPNVLIEKLFKLLNN